MNSETHAFSQRYLSQVEAERQYLWDLHKKTGDKPSQMDDLESPVQKTLSSPLDPKAMPTLEEAYRSVRAENRRKPFPPGN